MQSWELLLQYISFEVEVQLRSLRFRSCDLPTTDTTCNFYDGIPRQTLLYGFMFSITETLSERRFKSSGDFLCRRVWEASI